MVNKTGRAYAFFDCHVPLNEIKKAMPKVRKFACSPSELELSLQEGFDVNSLDPELNKMISQPRDLNSLHFGLGNDGQESIKLRDFKYMMIAEYPNQTNEKAAGELGDVLNYVSYLDEEVRPSMFKGAVLYEKDGKYHFRA